MPSSSIFPFSPQWVFPVPARHGSRLFEFVISFSESVPEGLFVWLISVDVEFGKFYFSPEWRGFPAGHALRFSIPDRSVAEAIKKAAPKGGGGSLHPACAMLF